MVTNMQPNECLTCLAQPLTLWIINLPLCLTCRYGRQRLASPAQVVTTSFSRIAEIKLSAAHTVSLAHVSFWSCYLSSLSENSLCSKRCWPGVGQVHARWVSEWGAALIASSCSPSGTAAFSAANVSMHTNHWASAIVSFVTACS